MKVIGTTVRLEVENTFSSGIEAAVACVIVALNKTRAAGLISDEGREAVDEGVRHEVTRVLEQIKEAQRLRRH